MPNPSKGNRVPNESNIIGKRLEKLAYRMLQGFPIQQSGGGKFWKLDFHDLSRFIYSCKGTKHDKITISKEMIREAQAAAQGARGRGDGYKPAICIGLGITTDDEVVGFLVLGADWVDANTAPPEMRPIASSKAAERMAKAR